jgi:hypothetical protein
MTRAALGDLPGQSSVDERLDTISRRLDVLEELAYTPS